jgi:hypothetical protein
MLVVLATIFLGLTTNVLAAVPPDLTNVADLMTRALTYKPAISSAQTAPRMISHKKSSMNGAQTLAPTDS